MTLPSGCCEGCKCNCGGKTQHLGCECECHYRDEEHCSNSNCCGGSAS